MKFKDFNILYIKFALAICIVLSFQNCSPVQFQMDQSSTGVQGNDHQLSVIEGACGLSHADIFSIAPINNLCSQGTPSTVVGSGPWSWTCAGSQPGLEAVCAANKEGLPAVAVGACGTSHLKEVSSTPRGNLCASGVASSVTGSGPWTWSCSGANGGPSASCFATKPVPVNGVCGASHSQNFASIPTENLCSKGTASGVSGIGPWVWTCAGLNGGAAISCSANKVVGNSCAPVPGVTTANWTGSVIGYKKSNAVRQGSVCPASTFSCNDGVVKLNGSTFALSISNSDYNNYTSSSTGCKQVPNITCDMNYSYSSGGVFVNWSLSNTNQEYINLAASTYSCTYAGQTVSGPLSNIIGLNKAGPVDANVPLNCSLSIQDTLGQTRTCGGYTSMYCSVTAVSAAGGYNMSWDLGGYSSGNYILKVNGSAQSPVSLPAGSSAGSTVLPSANYNIAANLYSSDGSLKCEASTTVSCGGTAPLYAGTTATGLFKQVLPDPSSPGQCMCEGGLVYDKSANRCQKACPMGTHFNDRNGVYTCDSCKDATIVERNGAYTLVGTLLSNTNAGNVCVYPGYSQEMYEDPASGSSCYIRNALVGWSSGAPTTGQFNANSYPSDGGSSCGFHLLNADKAYMWNCSKTTVRAGACMGAGGGTTSGASGGGVNSRPY